MSAVAVCSSGGALGRANQDAACTMLARTTVGDVGMAVVCDGVGGLACGEKASATVAHAFYNWFQNELSGLVAQRRQLDFDAVQSSWATVLKSLNNMLYKRGSHGDVPMGTTFTGLLACSGTYMVGHVGDSRAYKILGNGEEQLTEDQTLEAYLQQHGHANADESSGQAEGHAILQAVGAASALEPVFSCGTFAPQDAFVLCTDGAYRTLENGDLIRTFSYQKILEESALQEACDSLVQACINRGECDNITVACIGPQPCQDSSLTIAVGGERP